MHTVGDLRTQKCEQNPKIIMNIEGTIGFVTSSSSRNLIEDCLHEDIYCRLPAFGLRANDALT